MYVSAPKLYYFIRVKQVYQRSSKAWKRGNKALIRAHGKRILLRKWQLLSWGRGQALLRFHRTDGSTSHHQIRNTRESSLLSLRTHKIFGHLPLGFLEKWPGENPSLLWQGAWTRTCAGEPEGHWLWSYHFMAFFVALDTSRWQLERGPFLSY